MRPTVGRAGVKPVVRSHEPRQTCQVEAGPRCQPSGNLLIRSWLKVRTGLGVGIDPLENKRDEVACFAGEAQVDGTVLRCFQEESMKHRSRILDGTQPVNRYFKVLNPKTFSTDKKQSAGTGG